MEARAGVDWRVGAHAIDVRDEASLAIAREEVRRVALAAGLEPDRREAMAIVATELARNQIRHARGGRLLVRKVLRGGTPGVEVIAADRGGGIRAIAAALEGGRSSVGGLGGGIPAVVRLSDEVDIDVRVGAGTCLWARAFAAPPPYRSEVGIVARPCGGESACGDDAMFVRTDEALLLVVADGLGHGVPAAEASSQAVAVAFRHADLGLPEIVGACDAGLSGTRGTVLLVGRVERARQTVELVSVGNIQAHLCGARGPRSAAGGLAGTVGVQGRPLHRPVRTEAQRLAPGEWLIAYTDGLRAQTRDACEPGALREHPVLVASSLLEQFGRDNDDALVMVVA